MRTIKNLTVGLTRFWWVPLITGLLFIAFGIWCFVNPALSIETMAYIFSYGMFLAGFLDLGYALFNRRANVNWGWSMALGLLEILIGAWLIALPAPTLTSAFIFAVGIWIIFAAINALCEACMMSSFTGGAAIVWMVLLLIATIALAALFMFNPLMGAVAVWLYLGISLITFGVYRITLAFTLKGLNRRLRSSW